MLEQERLLDIVKFELVADDVIEFTLALEEGIVVLLLHLVLLHHTSAAGHQLHLFNAFRVGKHQAKNAVETVDEKEGPAHGRNVSRVKCVDHQALLEHLLEFVTKREGYLRSDETLEHATDASEHDDMDDTLNVLLEHIVHHVGVLHHVHGTGRLNLAM